MNFDELTARIADLTMQGYDPEDIAEFIGVTEEEVLRILNEQKENKKYGKTKHSCCR